MKPLHIALAVCGVAVVGAGALLATRSSTDPADAELVAGLVDAAAQINESAPRQLDVLTTLDGAKVDGATIEYRHTVAADWSEAEIEDFKTNQPGQLTALICESAAMMTTLNAGGIFVYSYRDGTGRDLGAFRIDRTNCTSP